MRLVVPLLLFGCTSMTPEEAEYRNGEDMVMWEMCQDAYEYLGRATVSTHSHRRGERHDPFEVRQDLKLNRCRRLLKDVWE